MSESQVLAILALIAVAWLTFSSAREEWQLTPDFIRFEELLIKEIAKRAKALGNPSLAFRPPIEEIMIQYIRQLRISPFVNDHDLLKAKKFLADQGISQKT